MEVHTHPHPASGGTMKRWTHYFREFLMLFLAVMCGFWAEKIKEQSVERQGEKQFIQSYIGNLKTDTATVKQNILFRKQRATKVKFPTWAECLSEPAGFKLLTEQLNKLKTNTP